MSDQEQLAFGIDGQEPNSRQAKRVESISRAFGFLSLANQAYSFADQVKKENPRYSKNRAINPETGELVSYSSDSLELKGEHMDNLALEAMRDACFYCSSWQKQLCFVQQIEPSDRFRLGFEVRFRSSNDRKEFLKQLKDDPDTVCFTYH